MMKRLADERKLRLAADAVLEFMHEHPIAAHWGRSDLASSDMMSLETTRKVWQAGRIHGAARHPSECTHMCSIVGASFTISRSF